MPRLVIRATVIADGLPTPLSDADDLVVELEAGDTQFVVRRSREEPINKRLDPLRMVELVVDQFNTFRMECGTGG